MFPSSRTQEEKMLKHVFSIRFSLMCKPFDLLKLELFAYTNFTLAFDGMYCLFAHFFLLIFSVIKKS